MKNINWDNVQEAGEFKNPTAGGYAAKIIGVEDNEDREFLLITWDFADGEFKGTNADYNKRLGYFPHHAKTVRSYKDTALPFFKGFKTAVEKSNPGYTFRNDPQSLVGKFCGVVLGEEEYQKNNGNIGTRLYVDQVRSGQAIREGDFKVPELKKLTPQDSTPSYIQQAPAAGNDYQLLADEDAQLPF